MKRPNSPNSAAPGGERAGPFEPRDLQVGTGESAIDQVGKFMRACTIPKELVLCGVQRYLDPMLWELQP